MLSLSWPFKYKKVGVSQGGYFGRLGPYDYYIKNGKRIPLPHTGSDYPVPCDTILNSPDNGKVIQAYDPYPPATDYYSGYGRFIRVRLNNGYQIGFAHLSQVWVKTGQSVKKGQRLGNTGNTGSGSGCHVHVELYNPSKKLVDPAKTIVWYNNGTEMLDREAVTWLYRSILGREPDAQGLKTWTSVTAKQAIKGFYTSAERKKKVQIAKNLKAQVPKLRGELEKAVAQAKTQVEVNTTLSKEITALQEQVKKQAEEIAELKLKLATPPVGAEKPIIPRVSKKDAPLQVLWKRILQWFNKRG